MGQRYRRVEKELFARVEGVGREIENCVTGNDRSRIKDQGGKAESASAVGYGSAGYHEKFAESLAKTGANEARLRGRLAAVRSEGTHSGAAPTMGKGATRAARSSACREAKVGACRG
ncbi:hypothetical protein BJQ89_01731 [Arthrobacter sp. ES1]|nr:hypothetical protein [Arthrobacter sp. ES1]